MNMMSAKEKYGYVISMCQELTKCDFEKFYPEISLKKSLLPIISLQKFG